MDPFPLTPYLPGRENLNSHDVPELVSSHPPQPQLFHQSEYPGDNSFASTKTGTQNHLHLFPFP